MHTNRHTKIFITLILLAALVLPFINTQIAQAAVVFDFSSSATTGASTAQTLSWTHTTGGTERILVVGVSVNTNTLVSSITYGGLPLTKITALENGNAVRVSLWYLLNPPTGSQTVTVNMLAAARFVAGAHSYAGVNQQAPFGTPVTSRGNGTSASLAISSNINEIVVDVVARRGDLTTNPITAGGGQTTRWNTRTTVNSGTNGITGGGSSKAGAPSITTSWSWPATRAWAMAGISLKPAQAPDTTPPLRFNGLPFGTLPSGTTQTTHSLETDENATCRYSTSAGVLYSSMPNTFSATGGTSHSGLITGLTDGSSHSFYIRCQDSVGNRNGDDFIISFSVASPLPDTEPPATPQNLTATAFTFSSIGLNWSQSTDNVGVDGYKIFRDNILLTTVSAIDNSYVDKSVSEQTTYTYQILAFDASGNESQKSAAANATTPAAPPAPDTEPPSTPTNVSAQAISQSQINLSWNVSTDNIGVAAYRIYRNGAHIASVNNSSYSDEGLDDATTYSYEVSAIDASLNESARSDLVSATTFSPPSPPDTLPPLRFNGIPSGVLPSDTQSATLSLSTDENAVCKYADSSGVSFDAMPDTFSTTGGVAHSATITDPSAGTNYSYHVRCRDSAGNANTDDFIIDFSVAPFVDTVSPTVPENLSVISVSATHISFSWSQSTDNIGIAGYKVFRNDELIATTRDDQYSESGLLESTTYAYRVSAYDATDNESEKSAPLIITTLQSDTDAPVISNISVSNITSSSALISWQTNEPATSRVEYGFSASYGVEKFDGSLVSDHSLVLAGLSGGTTYHFRVRSTDGSGNSAFSVDQTFETLFAPDTTPPAAISDLSVGDFGPTFADIFWTAPGDDDITGQAKLYDIRRSMNPINDSNWNSAIKLTGEPIPTLAGTVQNYLAIGLNPGTTYYFAVRSTDEAGNESALSNVVSVTTPTIQTGGGGGGGGYTADTTPPAEPSNFQAIPAEDQILLRWKNPQDADFVRVVVVREIGSPPSSPQDGVVVYEGDKEEFVDAGLFGNDTFYYGISAYDRIPNYSQLHIINTKLQAGITRINLPKPEIPKEENKEEETITESNSITAGFKFLRSLFFGVRGSDVSELQKILARNKVMYPQGIISGYFGNLTRQAVEKFQCAYGIVCFGVEKNTGHGRVGPQTALKLNELITRNPDFIPQAEFNLSFGARGNAVKILQEFLAKDSNVYPEGLVTGYFGKATRDAVKKFQCLHDIVCTGDEATTGYGRVGPRTKAKINELLLSAER